MVSNEILLRKPVYSSSQSNQSVVEEISTEQKIINFINIIEGWKTKCKNLHWSAPKKNIHVYLDEFLGILSDYQDGLAEETMGIFSKFQPNILKGSECECLNALDFIMEVKGVTFNFYSSLPDDVSLAGIKSECETFIHNIHKYIYLFNLCDIHPY